MLLPKRNKKISRLLVVTLTTRYGALLSTLSASVIGRTSVQALPKVSIKGNPGYPRVATDLNASAEHGNISRTPHPERR